jgi:biotin-dependent carboxylase-like uncharacterized protein
LSWRGHRVKKGDIVSVGSGAFGMRTCLAVSGGIETPLVMESRSTYLRGGFGGLEGRALRAGDVLALGEAPKTVPAQCDLSGLIPPYSAFATLRVVMGPQEDSITRQGREVFLSGSYEVTTRSDRMGTALSGPVIELVAGADILSDGACPGSVQVHGNGRPTILTADCQTTGGYAKIATVISVDLPLIAQLAPGNRVRFEAVGLLPARELYLRNEFLLGKIRR